jgi:hypothetical protein
LGRRAALVAAGQRLLDDGFLFADSRYGQSSDAAERLLGGIVMIGAVWISVRTDLAVCPLVARAALGTYGPDFVRDVRPILAEHCFACHGPDAGRRLAGLGLCVGGTQR